ncbi:hypothetical protein B9Z19DRAFT_990752 [Tuber borchii]|uniref:Cora-domain-containing protein n=1 Tax=Tuber borchii TaxID=42251 RepID=A0A2T6ZLQ1_TUBBO|nr:hypothetical protein B9Z19DRAFT_990752 [Tuber borchii]
MDTPRSESPHFTPAPAAELDDHRFQAHSLPRSGTMSSDVRTRPDISLIVEGAHSPIHRDYEQAVLDDDTRDSRPALSPDDCVGHQYSVRYPSRSSSRVSSARSPSPPNSVDAFANPEHRRRVDRSATISSQAPADLALGLRRTMSRRPTFTEDEAGGNGSGDEALPNAEEDVCFPPPEENTIPGGIDFEEMDEFVANQSRAKPCERRRKMSTCGDPIGSRYFDQIKAREDSSVIPSAVGKEAPISSASSVNDEKAEFCNTPTTPRHRRVSNPDRFSFFSSEGDATIHAPEIGDLLCDGENFHDLFRGGQGVWWLDCYNPTTEELAMLMKAFAIHPLTAEDIRVQETREKVELFRSYYFVCFRSFVQNKNSPDFMEPVNVYVIVFREGVLSFHFAPCPHSANVRKRIRQLRDYVALSSDWICYALIDDITDSFGPVIHDIEQESDAIEDGVFVARTDDYTAMLRQIGECRKKCMTLMRLLGGKADVIKGFAKRCNEQYQVTPRGEIGLYLGDIQDHVVTMMGNLSHFEKMLSRSHSNYLAQLSVDSIQANNRANEVLGKITTIATILVPLNLICGLFGMNVRIPGQHDPHLYWFFGILATIFLFVTVSFCLAKRWRFI